MARPVKSIFQTFFRVNRAVANWLVARYPAKFGGDSHRDVLFDIIKDELQARTGQINVLEVGGIDRPLLSRHKRLRYDGLDVDRNDLCSVLYDDFYQQTAELPFPATDYHLIFSNTTLEHVPDVRATYQNIYEALAPGGLTCHYYPCKGHPYALILRGIGHRWQNRLIRLFDPASAAATGYRTYFDHASFGETLTLLSDLGYTDIAIRPRYRANRYFDVFLPAFLAISAFENAAARYDLLQFCSGIIVSARKPS